AHFLHDHVVSRILDVQGLTEDHALFDRLRDLLEKILEASGEFKREPGFSKIYGELLSVYILVLYRCGAAGRESPLIRMILTNIARRKAVECNQAQLDKLVEKLDRTITVAIIAKRYAVYVLVTRGLKVLLRSEIDFLTFGKAPESLALQIANLLMKNGVRLSEVSDIVCGGGDLGTLPDGIYVLNTKVRDESWKRLRNSSLNRGALIAYELKEILRNQGEPEKIHLSLVSPLSFTTIGAYEMSSFLKAESQELSHSLRGHVKVTPLKSIAALISEIQTISPDDLNLLVMTLDELFASVVRKTGPHVVRELAAQDANTTLSRFDFDKIVKALEHEGFLIPPHFGLASQEVGTGVKEICELLMIINSGRISQALAQSLMRVVDLYARRVAMILEMSSAGAPSERPHFVVITSMMALDPNFLQLFGKIRNRIENPFTPVLCLDSLEHEYLIARQLFEMYISPAERDGRLHFSVEASSMRQALRVLQSSSESGLVFSFDSLLEQMTGVISEGKARPASIVLVGADNEDALVAVANAREYGLARRVVLIGDPHDIMQAILRTQIPLSPQTDPDLQILATDPLAVDFESKKKSMAEVFRGFLKEHSDFVIMKGSLATAPVLKQALSIYKERAGQSAAESGPVRRLASHTALFVLPDGRFFALSDAAVNPSFRSAADLLATIENQIEIIRKVVDPQRTFKVAIITAVEKQTSAIPATHLAAQAVEAATDLEERYGPLIVEGPLSFDLATAPDVAKEKAYEGRIKGDADCLVATDINTANVLYKMLSKTMGSLGLMVETGSIITAGPDTAPIVLTSRGDTAQTKFNSILLAFAYAHAQKESPIPGP
ncbi:MAG: phosphate acyltransferase, partial [Deltaproteobacteria bacterium]